MKEEKFPHIWKPLRGRRRAVARGKLLSHGGEHSNSGAEGKSERLPHRGSAPTTSTYQTKRLVCSPAGTGGGWELRLGLRRSDSRERTGVGGVNTA